MVFLAGKSPYIRCTYTVQANPTGDIMGTLWGYYGHTMGILRGYYGHTMGILLGIIWGKSDV